MRLKNIIVLFIVSLILTEFAYSQQTPAKKDSTKFYRDIETYSKRNNFTKSVYRLIFKPVKKKSPKKKVKKKVYKKLIKKPYSAFEGKTIRHINIETLDPFGYSITDTTVVPQNFFLKTGNNLHIKSQPITIRNLLLIHQNQPFDSLLVNESERLVRSMNYVRDVSFYVVATSKNSDSVDIFIREADIWSIIPDAGITGTSFNIHFTDKNFLGLGHESQDGLTWYYTNGDFAYKLKYSIPNIRNTYIKSTLLYELDEQKNFTKSLAIDRPFFSPLAKWAAGFILLQQFRKDSIYVNDSLSVQRRVKYNTQDYWAGSAIRIFKGNTVNSRTTNFISTVRFLRTHYLEKPIELYDTEQMFTNEDLYLASIGISTRKYVQDKYIFKFGVTEDVPVGKVFSLTGGFHEKNTIGRLYLGARISFGHYYPWGYISSNFEYGTYIHASHTEQAVFTAGINYFTGLFEIGSWKIREFAKPQITIGINRYPNDSLTLNDGPGLDGFNSPELTGTSRLLITLQTQSYAPWNLIGFRFGPFLAFSFGMLGNEVTGFSNSKVYSSIGLGVLIKNESLLFNPFQISIVFYPSIPGTGQNVLKTNSVRSTDFGFRDFEIGKPVTVEFQ